jgi:hypothetical protein
VKGHGFKPIPNPNAEPNFYCHSQVGGENYVGTPVLNVKVKENVNVSEQKVRSKKKIMMSRASAAAETQKAKVTGRGDLLPEDTSDEKPHVYNANDGSYLVSGISRRIVPPAVNSSVQTPPQAQNLKNANNSSQANSLMHLGETTQRDRSLTATSSVKPDSMDEFLSLRLAQLQREQVEIELIRRARISASHNSGADPSQFLPCLESFSGQLAGGLSYIAQTNQRLSVSEAIREANQLEEMAIASRNRARFLALTRAMGSGYDAFAKVTEPR